MDEATGPARVAASGVAHTSAFRQTWDTADVRPGERFSYYRDAMCKTFLACTPEAIPDAEVAARVEMAAFQDGGIARCDSSLFRVTRTPDDVKKLPEEYIALTLITAGQMQLDYKDTSMSCKKGDVALMEGNQSFDCHKRSDGSTSLMGLSFKRSTLQKMIGSDFTADYLITDQKPLSVALFNCLDTIDKRLITGSLPELSALYSACQCLVAAHFAQDKDLLEAASVASTSVSQGLLASIKSFVDHNLGDSDLSPPVVARKFGISVRYIHKLFDATDETFSNYILNRRLDRIQADLTIGLKAHHSLEEIANGWGFRDMTTFYRNFKRRYDTTPKQMRYAASDAYLKSPRTGWARPQTLDDAPDSHRDRVNASARLGHTGYPRS